MGTDKGLLIHEAKTWAQTVFDKLKVLEIPIHLSVNNQQIATYSKWFRPSLLIADSPSIGVKGPLLGVLSCHLQSSEEDLFLLACDLPLMETGLIKELFALYMKGKNYEAFVFTNNDQPEPLCAIYRSKGLKKIMGMLAQNKLAKHSMKFVLEQLNVSKTILKDAQIPSFRNFNAHAKLNGL
jgi:molybdopterin-guanine dinucleotide biosynthesis protein A